MFQYRKYVRQYYIGSLGSPYASRAFSFISTVTIFRFRRAMDLLILESKRQLRPAWWYRSSGPTLLRVCWLCRIPLAWWFKYIHRDSSARNRVVFNGWFSMISSTYELLGSLENRTTTPKVPIIHKTLGGVKKVGLFWLVYHKDQVNLTTKDPLMCRSRSRVPPNYRCGFKISCMPPMVSSWNDQLPSDRPVRVRWSLPLVSHTSQRKPRLTSALSKLMSSGLRGFQQLIPKLLKAARCFSIVPLIIPVYR